MADWLRKITNKKQKTESVEDFVLYEQNDGGTENQEFSDTDRLEIPEHLLHPAKTGILSKFSGFYQKHKKAVRWSGISAVALILAISLALAIPVWTDPLRGYTQVAVAKGNVVSTLKVSGTLAANAHYSITSLVSGTVLESAPQVGDRVDAGSILYKLDDTDAQLALKRAENQLEKSKASGDYTTSPLRIYALEDGVIQSMTIRNGHTVSAGQVIGTLMRSDESIVSITSSVSGTVYSVNVSQGVSVSAGTLLATVRDNQAEQSQRSSIYDQKNSEYDVEAAKNHLENYTIISPVSGVVTEKTAKVGDVVSMTDSSNPMMVITDTSSMRFTFQIEESRLPEIKKGLRANVTTDSVPNKTFTGTVNHVSAEGIRNKDGKLMFDVEVLVENPGSLKAGMNVSAKVILASANNTLYLPQKALQNPSGQTAKVLVKELIPSDTAEEPATTNASVPAKQEQPALPEMEVPKGCRLVTVRYGVSNGSKVQILSGLKAGDTVVYHPDWEDPDLKQATTAATVQPESSLVTPKPTSPDDAAEDEALRQEIMDRIRENESEATPNTQVVFPIS